jgi:hypothetical protein
LNARARGRNESCMTHASERSSRPSGDGRDELDDSWFDLPVILDAPASPPAKAREPESELDDSWFDRPGGGIRRSDVLGR